MTNKIKTKSSTASGSVPSSLLTGELAINLADSLLYVGNGASINAYHLMKFEPSISMVQDRRPLGEHGGTSREEKWNVRSLNHLEYNVNNTTTLVGDDFVLSSGVYHISILCKGNKMDEGKVRLWNETTSVSEFEGLSINGDSSQVYEASGVVISNGTDLFEVQHYSKKKKEKKGLGEASKIGDYELYTTVKIERIA